MTDFGRRAGGGDMLRAVYDPNKDGVIAVAQTQADMTKAVYDPALAALAAILADHSEDHESGGDDEVDVTGLTGTTPACLLGDGTAGRTIRQLLLNVIPGTDPNTLKCNTANKFNHTAVSPVDNVAKGATTGGFSLNADGTYLTIEAAILEGNVLFAQGPLYKIEGSGSHVVASLTHIQDDIRVGLINPVNNAFQDWTVYAVERQIRLFALYVTA